MTFTNQCIQLINQSPALLEQANTLLEVYYLIDQLNEAVKFLYPYNGCTAGCSSCCEGSSVPVIYTIEWELIYNFIKNLDDGIQQEIINRTKEIFDKYSELLWLVHDHVQTPPSKEKLDYLVNLLPQLNETTCIFLVLGKCGIYPVRSAKCRSHGCFLFKFEDFLQLQGCSAEVERMEEHFKKQGTRQIIMPLWNHFETKMAVLHGTAPVLATIIPIWLYAHIDGDKLIDNVIKYPDFEALKKKHK